MPNNSDENIIPKKNVTENPPSINFLESSASPEPLALDASYNTPLLIPRSAKFAYASKIKRKLQRPNSMGDKDELIYICLKNPMSDPPAVAIDK